MRGETWKRFRRSTLATTALIYVIVMSLVALFAPLLANRKPLIARDATGLSLPAFADYWSDDPDIDAPSEGRSVVLRAPVPFSPNAIELGSRLASPKGAHLLGTDDLGRDVLARLIHGARVS